MYLGIDLGTSAVKAVVIDEDGAMRGEATSLLNVLSPGPLMSEQNPDDWLTAVNYVVADLSGFSSRIRGIGLSGQMHGATVLDKHLQPLRPAILWNDGRAALECDELASMIDIHQICGNDAFPGFTAPKLLWLRKHEPGLFQRIDKVLLPKDYIRLQITNTLATDCSDASGTLWLDVKQRQWSDEALAACDLSRNNMPEVFEGSDVTAVLSEAVASAWGMQRVPVVAGAGDQAAGAIGAGAINPGSCTLSLGTSGVVFSPCTRYQPSPEDGLHMFCHALPELWHHMAVILSAGGSLTWLVDALQAENESDLLSDLDNEKSDGNLPIFLPYLSGERTPHNDALAKGVFFGLDHNTKRAQLVKSVLEGVAFALKDGYAALERARANLSQINVIGGGTQSSYWANVLASVLGRSLTYREESIIGPALGAARLAILGISGRSVNEVCSAPPIVEEVEPMPELQQRYEQRYSVYRSLYQSLEGQYRKFQAIES